jgi:N-acyl-D-amino-acid deacylase
MLNNKPMSRSRFCLLLAVLLPGLLWAAQDDPDYDLVIRNGRVLDGAGNPWFLADLAIDDGRIVKIGHIDGSGGQEIEAKGQYVSPGWIDMMDQSTEVLLKNGDAANKILMGVTSAIGGEGGTPVAADKLPEYFGTMEQQGIGINFGVYYNVFQAREAVAGTTDVEVSADQVQQMQAIMRLAMENGAVGMSSAAFYPPESLITTEQLIAMAQAIAPYGGIYAAHMRDESRKLLTAIDEMITVGETAGIPVEIFHIKNAFQPNWGSEADKAIALIEAARSRGVEIAADQYPYIAGGTGLDATVPSWVFNQGMDKALEILRDPAMREQLKAEVLSPESDRMLVAAGSWKGIVLANPQNAKYDQYVGQNFEEIGQAMDKDPADAAWDMMLEALPNRAYAFYYLMSEEDVRNFMQQPWVSIGSDAGSAAVLGQMDDTGLPHPRAYGTFPRIIAEYVREEGVLSLEDAIRKMTSWPASRMKLQDRGLLAPGYWADVVIFDYDTIQDNATWDDAMQTPTGISHVLVNGVVVAAGGKHTGQRPGKVLYGPGTINRGTRVIQQEK